MDIFDDLDGLETDLAIRRSGWYRHVNPETGALAIFPYEASDPAEWEAKATAQAAESVALEEATRPADKPAENTFQVRRGD